MEKQIEIINLITGYKTHAHTKIISGPLNDALYAGCLTSLLGPNGAGKSTLLRTITGIQSPLGGKVVIDQREIAKLNAKEMAQEIAIVLTERPEVDDMRTFDMVAMGRAPYTGFWGNLSDYDIQVVENAMHITGVSRFAGHYINDLSDGERQKVMIAKALAQQTNVIILDEPTAFLDYPSKIEVMQLLRSLAENEGKTILVSTHDLEIALQLSHNIWLLDSQHGLTSGSRDSVISRGDLRRYFPQPCIDIDCQTGHLSVI